MANDDEVNDEEDSMRAEVMMIQVLGPDSAPVPEARAIVISHYYETLLGSRNAPLRADTHGYLSVPRDTFQNDEQRREALLLVWAPGYAAMRTLITEGEAIRLTGARALRGQLTGQPGLVDHVWLSGTDDAPWPFFIRCDVDDDGRFQVAGVALGTFRMSSRAEGEHRFSAPMRKVACRFWRATQTSYERAPFSLTSECSTGPSTPTDKSIRSVSRLVQSPSAVLSSTKKATPSPARRSRSLRKALDSRRCKRMHAVSLTPPHHRRRPSASLHLIPTLASSGQTSNGPIGPSTTTRRTRLCVSYCAAAQSCAGGSSTHARHRCATFASF